MSVSDYFKKVQPTVVIHTAAYSGTAELNVKNPALILEYNLKMSLNILRISAEVGVKKVLQIGSIAAYPFNPDNIPFQESDLHTAPPDQKDLYYASAKRLSHLLGKAHQIENNVRVITLVVNGIIGPNMHINDGKEVMLGGLINRFHNANLDEKLVVFGNPKSKRQYTYSLDLAQIILMIIEDSPDVDLLNIGNTEQYSLMELAKMVCQVLGRDPSRIIFPNVNAVANFQNMDNSLFLRNYKYNFSKLESAIKDTYRWFLENKINV